MYDSTGVLTRVDQAAWSVATSEEQDPLDYTQGIVFYGLQKQARIPAFAAFPSSIGGIDQVPTKS